MAGPGRPKKSTALASQSRKVYDSEIEPEDKVQRRLPLARTPEAREAQLASLAYDLAEKQFLDGSASSQVTVHFLKVGSTLQRQELEKLKQETLLVQAKVKEIANAEEMKKLYQDAMDAMRGYGGHDTGEVDDPIIF